MDVARGQRPQLSRADWVAAAVTALHAGGLDAVAVEPLAARLGATKGSFYWHFRDREDLVAAALAHWEHQGTDEVIAALDAAADPARRLRMLAEATLAEDHRPDLSVVLLPDAAHPLVAAALERVTRRRTDYLTAQFRALGIEAHEASARSLLAYSAFLGHSQLRHYLPAAVDTTTPAAYLAVLDRALLHDRPAPEAES
jgi:AcrR family transcriptional regulator